MTCQHFALEQTLHTLLIGSWLRSSYTTSKYTMFVDASWSSLVSLAMSLGSV